MPKLFKASKAIYGQLFRIQLHNQNRQLLPSSILESPNVPNEDVIPQCFACNMPT